MLLLLFPSFNSSSSVIHLQQPYSSSCLRQRPYCPVPLPHGCRSFCFGSFTHQ